MAEDKVVDHLLSRLLLELGGELEYGGGVQVRCEVSPPAQVGSLVPMPHLTLVLPVGQLIHPLRREELHYFEVRVKRLHHRVDLFLARACIREEVRPGHRACCIACTTGTGDRPHRSDICNLQIAHLLTSPFCLIKFKF